MALYQFIISFLTCLCNMLGTVHEFGTPEYNALITPEKRKAGSRSVIVINVHKVATVSAYFIATGRIRTLSLISNHFKHHCPRQYAILAQPSMYLGLTLPDYSRVASAFRCTNSSRTVLRSNGGVIPWKPLIIPLLWPPLK